MIESKEGVHIGDLCFKGLSEDRVTEIGYAKRDVRTDKPLTDQRMKKVTVDTFGVEYPEPENLNLTAVPFTATKPAIGTANSTSTKNMSLTGEGAYTKSNYTLNGWYTDSALTEDSKVDETAPVAVPTERGFYLKSTYNGSTGGTPVPTKYPVDVTDATADKTKAAAGETVTITVTPKEGYELDTLTVKDAKGNEIELTDLGDGKYSFEMPSAAVSVEATFAQLPAYATCPKDETCIIEKYTDTANDAWWHDGVHYCVENKLMQGVSATEFDPDGPASRAMVATILWYIEGRPVVNYGLCKPLVFPVGIEYSKGDRRERTWT